MGQLLFKVAGTFLLQRIGLVVASDRQRVEIPVRVGSAIEVRCSDGSSIITKVAGIEMICPPPVDAKLAILLPKEIGKEDVPVGAEVWSVP